MEQYLLVIHWVTSDWVHAMIFAYAVFLVYKFNRWLLR